MIVRRPHVIGTGRRVKARTRRGPAHQLAPHRIRTFLQRSTICSWVAADAEWIKTIKANAPADIGAASRSVE